MSDRTDKVSNDETRELINQYREDEQNGDLHPSVKRLRKREEGKGLEVVKQAEKKYPGQIRAQIDYFVDHAELLAGTGRHRKVSLMTRKNYRQRLTSFFNHMKKLNMPVHGLMSVTPRQVRRVVEWMIQEKKSARYMRNVNTCVRRLGVLMGKPDLCPPMQYFTTDHEAITTQQVALKRKDWDGDDERVNAVIEEMRQICAVTAVQLEMGRHFGMRAQETWCAIPSEMVVGNSHLSVERGTKGGRHRHVPIETEKQREVLARAIELASAHPQKILSVPGARTLASQRSRFYYQMRKVGVTRKDSGDVFHGLRHLYANEVYKEMTGVESPVRGGALANPELDDKARYELSKRMGHTRKEIASHYIGHHRTLNKSSKRNIQRLIDTLEKDAELVSLCAEAQLKAVYVVGKHADGDAIEPKEVFVIGIDGPESFSMSDEGIKAVAKRVDALLACGMVIALPLHEITAQTPRLELLGLGGHKKLAPEGDGGAA